MIEFNRWPADLADLYQTRGYWAGLPLTHAVQEQARHVPHQVAIICRSRQITYGALDAAASALAARLQAASIGHGDTALVQLPNIAEFYMVFLGLLKAGVVPLNALFSHGTAEMTAYADQIAPRLLIASRTHPAFHEDAFTERLLADNPRMLVLHHDGKDGDERLDSWLQTPALDNFIPKPTPADEVAFFQLSGGSTGTPKLIPRTHNDYDYSVRASAEICGLGRDTRFLCALPAPHNFLLSSPGALGVFHAGGTVVLAPNPEPALCFDLIARHRITMAALVPAAVQMWLDAAGRDAPDLSSLTLVQVGGASFAEATAMKVPQILGCKLQQVFGMAEGLVNYTRLDDPPAKVFGTQGRPISPDDEVRVVTPDGDPVADGQPGLLATRGPYTFRGYYRSPDHNARSFDADGLYLTGDVVIRDRDGYLRVVGRAKDQINRGGEKIAAEEIEHLLLRHPGVVSAALIAVPDARLGERSCAVVIARQPLRAVELRRHLMSCGIADYKLPDIIRFVDTLPLTPVGKTDKRRLRQMLAADLIPG